jgi:hypothetical protein
MLETIAMPSTLPMSDLVHICGFPSGGTDLLRNLMNSHPDVDIVGELPLLPQLADRFGASVPGYRVPELAAALRNVDVYNRMGNPHADLTSLAATPSVPVAAVYAAVLSAQPVRWKGNKTPQNTENIDKLLRLFPETRFIMITRDVRDVCISWRRKWGKDIVYCAEKWRERMTSGLDRLAQLPENRRHVVRFEDLLRDCEGVAWQICRFLDVPRAQQMLAYHQHVDQIVDGKRNFGQPIDSTNIGNWRMGLSEREIRRVEEIAFPAMQRLGYKPEYARSPLAIRPLEQFTGLACDALAAVFIGNRYKSRNTLYARAVSIGVTLRRRLRSG